jgi:hypothetical protein
LINIHATNLATFHNIAFKNEKGFEINLAFF